MIIEMSKGNTELIQITFLGICCVAHHMHQHHSKYIWRQANIFQNYIHYGCHVYRSCSPKLTQPNSLGDNFRRFVKWNTHNRYHNYIGCPDCHFHHLTPVFLLETACSQKRKVVFLIYLDESSKVKWMQLLSVAGNCSPCWWLVLGLPKTFGWRRLS